MISHLCLIPVLALIPFVDAIWQFPEPVSGADGGPVVGVATLAVVVPSATQDRADMAAGPTPAAVRTTSDRSGEAMHGMVVRSLDSGTGGASDRTWRFAPDLWSPTPGLVTYYHPSLAGGLMRDGETPYDPEAIGPVAMTNYALGTWVEICGPTRRCLTAVVSDTGLLAANHADVSEAMFQVLVGDLAVGVAPVEITALE